MSTRKQPSISSNMLKLAYELQSNIKNFKHDVRQPLSTINIVSSIGKAVSADLDQANRFEHLHASQKAMSKLIDQFLGGLERVILDNTQSTQNQLCVFDIHTILAALVEEYRHLANAKGLELRYTERSLIIRTNKSQLEQIIRNGLDNAIKYTRSGGVVVGIRKSRHGPARVCIVDTGLGIANNLVKAKDKGWGHGSTIVHDLSLQLGVKTEVDNRWGKAQGSVFSVWIPTSMLSSPNNVNELDCNTPKVVMLAATHHLPLLADVHAQGQLPNTQIEDMSFGHTMWSMLRSGGPQCLIYYVNSQYELDQANAIHRNVQDILGFESAALLVCGPQFTVDRKPPSFQHCALLKSTLDANGGLQIGGLRDLLWQQPDESAIGLTNASSRLAATEWV